MYLEGSSDVIEQNFELAKDYFTSAIEKDSAAGYCGLGKLSFANLYFVLII